MPEISCIIMFHRSSNNIFKDTDYYYCSFELYLYHICLLEIQPTPSHPASSHSAYL